MNTANMFYSKSPTIARLAAQFTNNMTRRLLSNLSEEIERQNNIFNGEQQRQKEFLGRVEKIDIQYEGPSETHNLVMNKNLSTPHDVAKHLNQTIVDKSVVALLNNDTLWHMHKPLPDSCKLEFLHYTIPQPSNVNKIFWRSGSFVLGALAKISFKDNVDVQLHSFPSPNVRSGSFVYDLQLSLDDWQITQKELKVLSLEMIKFCQQRHTIECLDVSAEIALDLFKNNVHKHQQIPDIAAHHNGKVTLFRVRDHIDISRGPMVPNTSHFGRFTVANVHKLKTDIPGGSMYRFQGVSLPSPIVLNHFAYSVLEERARTLNPARIPGTQDSFDEDNSFLGQVAV